MVLIEDHLRNVEEGLMELMRGSGKLVTSSSLKWQGEDMPSERWSNGRGFNHSICKP